MGTIARTALAVAIAGTLAAPTLPATAGIVVPPQPQSRCAALKYKAAGNYARAILSCRATKLATGAVLTDPDCLDKARAKLDKAFARAEKKDDCLATGDQDYAADEAQGYVGTLPSILEGRVRCCTLQAVDQCTWAEDEEECEAFPGGTLGAPGSFCDGATGGCVAPPLEPQPGLCCDGLEEGNGCASNLPGDLCVDAGGSHSASQVCRPNGTCQPR
jgi:hypothetical protein